MKRSDFSQGSTVSAAVSSRIITEAFSSTSAAMTADSLSIQSLHIEGGGKDTADSFFKTAIDLDEKAVQKSPQSQYRSTAQGSEVRLPITVNLVALRETLFVEAPFVNKKNKAFWRKMLDGKHFSTILAAAYNFISVCITDSGNVLVDRLNDIQHSPLIETIAATVTDMFYTFKRLDRDLFFSRLPEVTMFLVIQSLQTACPKHHRLYNTVKFREIILDWCAELLWGIRATNSHANREWLFNDATDSHIMVTSSSSAIPMQRTKTNPNLAQISSQFSISHSPLIQMYMERKMEGGGGPEGRDETQGERKDPLDADSSLKMDSVEVAANIRERLRARKEKSLTKDMLAFDITLSHMSDRPLINMNSEAVVKLGNTKERKVDILALRLFLKQSTRKIQRISEQHQEMGVTLTQSLRDIRTSRRDKAEDINANMLFSLRLKKAQTLESLRFTPGSPRVLK